MTLQQYSRVRLITDRFETDGAKKGSMGFIIEIYHDSAYEIEFSDSQGITIAQIVATKDDIEPAPE